MTIARTLLGLLVALAVLAGARPAAGQATTCDDYGSQPAAQLALALSPERHAATLDPDGNGIACDHEAGAPPVTATVAAAPQPAETPAPQAPPETPDPQVPADVTIDVIDQQPVDTTSPATTPTPGAPETGALDGRLGGTQATFEAAHGAPVEIVPSEDTPAVVLRAYTPPATAADLYTIDLDDQVAIVVIEAASSWDRQQATTLLAAYLPTDVATLPNAETLADGSLLIPTFSTDLASEVPAETMSRAGIPGTPGDLYLLLIPGAAGDIVEMEIGLGNGDDLRAGLSPAG